MLGSEFAGEVVAIGAEVTRFAVGDDVFGISPQRLGAHAEFVCVAQDSCVARMPMNATFEQAAAVCDGALTALTGLRRAKLRAGQRVLVYGASGSIGTAAVQLAKFLAADVTAVCDTRNVDLVHSIGADHVIDYTREEFTTTGKHYDVIYDAVGKLRFRRSRTSLATPGTYLATDLWQNMALALVTPLLGRRRVKFPFPTHKQDDVVLLAHLIETGRYQPVIDRCYPLENVVEATRYVATGQKTGNVVLTLD